MRPPGRTCPTGRSGGVATPRPRRTGASGGTRSEPGGGVPDGGGRCGGAPYGEARGGEAGDAVCRDAGRGARRTPGRAGRRSTARRGGGGGTPSAGTRVADAGAGRRGAVVCPPGPGVVRRGRERGTVERRPAGRGAPDGGMAARRPPGRGAPGRGASGAWRRRPAGRGVVDGGWGGRRSSGRVAGLLPPPSPSAGRRFSAGPGLLSRSQVLVAGHAERPKPMVGTARRRGQGRAASLGTRSVRKA